MKSYDRKMPIDWSNKKLSKHIINRLDSNDNIIYVITEISNLIPLINLKETLNEVINKLEEKEMINLNNEVIIEFNKKLNRSGLNDHTSIKVMSEFYGGYLFHLYQAIYFLHNIGKELIPFKYKIHQGKLYHNKENILDEIFKSEKQKRINDIESLPLEKQKSAYIQLLKDFQKDQFINNSKKYNDYIKFFKKRIKLIEKEQQQKNNVSNLVNTEKPKQIPAKYYALYHWVLIEMGKEATFDRDINDKLNKTQIQYFAKNKYNLKKGRAQGFYKTFKDLDVTKKTMIPKEFGKDYKEKLILISENNAEVISFLRKYPN